MESIVATSPSEDSHSVVRNAGFLLAARIASTALGLVLVLFLARRLGVEQFGVYTLAYYFSASFVILGDLGLNNLLTRDIARNKSSASSILGIIVPLKCALNLCSLALGVAVLRFLDYPVAAELVVLIVLSAQLVFGSFIQTFHHVFEGFERMEFVALIDVSKKAVELGICFTILSAGFELKHLVMGIAVSETGFACLAWLTARRYLRLSIRPRVVVGRWWGQVQAAIPFGLILVFFEVMTSTDTIMLAKFRTGDEVGWYGAALRVTTVLSYLPLMAATAMFPTTARLMETSVGRAKDVLKGVLRIMILIAAPIAVGLSVTAEAVIHLLYTSAYSPAARPLVIFGWTIAVYCVSIPLVLFLSATNERRYATMVVGMAAAVNAVVNYLLIPEWGMQGAALATLASQLIVAGCCYGRVRLIFGGLKALKVGLQATFAAALMGAVIYPLSGIPVIPLMAAGAASYLGVLWIIRAIHLDDWISLRSLIRPRS